ncbi:hypothetical protein [Neptuniibacter sp. QD37_11]|uniref:hypothetical protein n=1 Tax=Neptuniibacter sp. QD37_11 TaxID=3398209 RepID=UPI0039F5E8AB
MPQIIVSMLLNLPEAPDHDSFDTIGQTAELGLREGLQAQGMGNVDIEMVSAYPVNVEPSSTDFSALKPIGDAMLNATDNLKSNS